MTPEQENAIKQLIRLADLMEGEERGSKIYKELQKEYRIYARMAMPEAFRKNRKPYKPPQP